MKRLINLILAFTLTIPVFNQTTLDEEIGFKLVKAEYLLGTERYEDAIKELNEIIKQNPNYKNAMLLRAETKYKLAAYKGAKADALEYISNNGITGRAAGVLGKADFALNAFDAALNSLTAAILLGERDVKIYEIRAEIYEKKNQKLSACEDWQNAAKLGSTKGAINAKRNCGVKEENPPTQDSNSKSENNESTNLPKNESDTSTTNNERGEKNDDKNEEPISEGTKAKSDDDNGELIPEEDNTINEIIIDEDLTLQIFGQGLGKRRMMEKPNILILAEKDGVVVVEICVNSDGRVDFAEFVPGKSTLNQNSIVSLAIRKSKEFWFEDSEYPKQCGFVKFVIKGS